MIHLIAQVDGAATPTPAPQEGFQQPDWLPGAMMLAGVVILVFFVMLKLRHRAARKTGERLTPHEQVERLGQESGVRSDLRNMMVELEDLTRRFSSQLDAKSIRLERLLDEAEARIEELRQLLDGQPKAAAPSPAAGSSPPVESDNGTDNVEEPDPLSLRVYELADAGRNPVQIARDLDEQVGKVELILALRQH